MDNRYQELSYQITQLEQQVSDAKARLDQNQYDAFNESLNDATFLKENLVYISFTY